MAWDACLSGFSTEELECVEAQAAAIADRLWDASTRKEVIGPVQRAARRGSMWVYHGLSSPSLDYLSPGCEHLIRMDAHAVGQEWSQNNHHFAATHRSDECSRQFSRTRADSLPVFWTLRPGHAVCEGWIVTKYGDMEYSGDFCPVDPCARCKRMLPPRRLRLPPAGSGCHTHVCFRCYADVLPASQVITAYAANKQLIKQLLAITRKPPHERN